MHVSILSGALAPLLCLMVLGRLSGAEACGPAIPPSEAAMRESARSAFPATTAGHAEARRRVLTFYAGYILHALIKGGVSPLDPPEMTRLLVSLEEFHGEDWSDELAGEWADACQEVTELMFDGYDEPSRM